MTDLESRFADHARSPLLETLDARIRLTDGVATTHLKVEERHLRSYNIAHGGVVCTLLDTAMGASAYVAHWKRAEALGGEASELVTSQLTIHFLRPAWSGESLVGRGHVVHHGTKTIVMRGEIETEGGELIASGSATFMPVEIPPSAKER